MGYIESNYYRGTKITGTSTTAKVFPKSGIKHVSVGATYVNTTYWHVYKCTVAGGPSVAKWRYTETQISKKPTVAVSKLGSPVRTTVGSGTHYMKATWSVPNALTNSTKLDRAEKLSIEWDVMISGMDLMIEKEVGTGVTQSQINLSNLTVGRNTYTRASFWPLTQRKLTAVTIKVRGKNVYGKGTLAKATREFVPPKAPTISGFTFNEANGHVSATITSDAGAGYAERYDTHYKVYVTDTRTGKSWVATDAASTATSITAAYDVTDYQQLSYGQYVKVTVSAWTRGYAGSSDVVSRSYYVSFPAQTTIRGVDITSKSSSGRCVARINTNNTDAHPVDGVKLEYLANCEYATESAIPGTAEWEDAGIQDDAQCTALTMPVTDLIPSAGNYSWIRVKSYHANESVLKRYSNYVRLKALETPAPTAEDERVKILSATAGDDGESVIVHLGWNATGTDDATGTELSWSEDSDTWKSTEEPETHTFEWSDGAVTVGGVTYHDSATITIKKLEGGTKYYIRARRYLDGEGDTTYSPYSNMATCYTSTAPEAVTATCDRYIPYGQPLPVRWTFAGNSGQKEWQIISTAGKVIASGKGSAGSARISAARLKSVATAGNPIKPSTKSGSIVTFDADEDTVISSLKVTITPKQAGSGDPSPSNVRPITGWTDADVTVAGKNLFSGEYILAYIENNRIITAASSAGGAIIPCKPNTTYTITKEAGAVLRAVTTTEKPEVGVATGIIQYGTDNYSKLTMTTDATAKYIFVWFRSNGDTKTAAQLAETIQCVEGSTVTPFEPYTGTTTPVPLGQTVYMAEGDVITGSWDDASASDKLSDIGTTYFYQGQYATALGFYLTNTSTTVSASEKRGAVSNMKVESDTYFGANRTNTDQNAINAGFAINAAGAFCIIYDSDTTLTKEQFLQKYAQFEVYYPKSTLTPFTTTPAEVRTLLGTNNVWSDAGNVTIKYGHKSTGSVNFNVRVSSGSGFVASENHTITIIDPPSLEITAPSQMTAQPYSFTASCTTVSDLIVIVTSSGAMGQYPDGVRMQTAGDTIYSERISPEWAEGEDEFTTTITLPTGLDFWDGVNYNMTVTAVDRITALRSEVQAATFDINWAHKAVDPEEAVTLTPIDEVSDDGVHRLAVEIALTPPTGCAETDLFDIYRMDGGIARLIGEGFPLTHTTADEYAPIGDGELLYYRIALRTQDGDVAFADIEYDLPVDTLRLDWRDSSVELPYNITVGDGYSKDVELRGHMDGSTDGYWNQNVTRKSSLSTDVITVDQQAEIEAVRRLARYAGPVFVRTPNGGAFEADVQVTNLSANNTHIANIALDANEINLTPEFILPTPYSFEEG